MITKRLKKRVSAPVSRTLVKKAITMFRPLILSRHPSHSPLRTQLSLLPFRSVIRLGSTTIPEDNARRIEINSVNSIKNSSSKLLMKQCFSRNNIKTASWGKASDVDVVSISGVQFRTDSSGSQGLEFPIVGKSHFGSRGEGNTKIDNLEQYNRWVVGKNLNNYILERYMPYKLEFRFHTNKNGCFYVCRKALMQDTPQHLKWMMNNETCVWYMNTNENFKRPNSYSLIEQECVRALTSLGLDFSAFDVRVQGPTDNRGRLREIQDFVIIEGNSAPSLKEEGLRHYLEQIPIILREKYRNS